jgi:acetyl esterase/lipase
MDLHIWLHERRPKARRPEGLPSDTPEVSPLLVENVGGLPSQLVYYSQHEILPTNASRWIERSKMAGVKISEHKGKGQLYTYSLG